MFKQVKYKDVLWLDLESPTESELLQINQEHKTGINDLVLGELIRAGKRPQVDIYNNDLIYLVLHFPSSNNQQSQEINFVIGKNFILTVHYEPVDSLDNFAKIFETDFLLKKLKKNQEKVHAGLILCYMLKEIYRGLERPLDLMNEKVRKVGTQISSARERETVVELTNLNRELANNWQWTLKAHGEILNSLAITAEELFGEKFRYYSQTISSEERLVWEMTERNRQALDDLWYYQQSLIAIRTRETMKILMLVVLIFLPLNLVVQIGESGRFGLALTSVIILLALGLARIKQWL